jgi:hypothetical protein
MSLNNVTLREERGKNMKTGGLAYLALIKDVKGAVVKKLQGEMPVDLNPDQVLSFKQSRFTDVEYFDAARGITPSRWRYWIGSPDKPTRGAAPCSCPSEGRVWG